MIIKKLKFRNVGIYGHKWQEIDFISKPTGLWLLKGKNSTGKTTILKLLRIILYFDLDGKSKKEIINEINKKQGEIEIQVESNSVNWRIHLGYYPDFVRLYKNGNEQPEDYGSLDVLKDFIKTQVSDIPLHIFRNTISLNIKSFKSFLSMKPEDARQIRDRLFNFYILNLMLTKIKASYNSKNDQIEKLNTIINSDELNLIATIEKLNSVKEQLLTERQIEIEKVIRDVDNTENQLESAQSSLKSFQKTQQKLASQIDVINNKIQVDDYNKLLKHKLALEKSVSEKTEQIKLEQQRLAESNSKYRDIQKIKEEKDKLAKIQPIFTFIENIKTKLPVICHNIKTNGDLQHKYGKLIETTKSTIDSLKQELYLNKKYKEVYDSNSNCPTCNSSLNDKLDLIEQFNEKIEEGTKKLEYSTKLLKDYENSSLEAKNMEDHNKTILKNIVDKIPSIKTLLASFDVKYAELTYPLDEYFASLQENIYSSPTISLEKLTEIFTRFDTALIITDSSQLDIEIKGINTIIQEFDNELSFHRNQFNDILRKFSVLESKVSSIDKTQDFSLIDINQIKEIENDKATIDYEISTMNFTIGKLELHKNSLNMKLSILKDTSDIDKQILSISILITDLENKIANNKNAINKILLEKYEDSILLDIVSDSGIKAFILQQIIPAINNEISQNLPKFDVNGNISFNSEFKPLFYRNGTVVNFDSFSEGAKAKMDVCTLISIIKTIKSRYNDINVMFLDEILSSIDIESREHIISTIKQICCNELGMHTFICNHSEIPSHDFDYKLTVTNDGNFSDINIETL